MNNVKKITALLLVLVLSLSLFACGSKPTEPTEPTEVTKQETEKQVIELVDQAGRKVVLDKPATKVVSTYYITTYAMISLGVSDKLVGIEKKADKRNLYKLAAKELLEVEQVGSMKEFNSEAVIALNPDLVLLPMKLKDNVATFEKLNIPVIVVNPESQKLVEEMLDIIGSACGVADRAKKLNSFYKDTMAEKAELIKGKGEPVVYIGSNSALLATAPRDMYQADLITRAGGKNAGSDLEGDYWTDVSYEKLISYNPEYIIIPSGAKYTVEDVLKDDKLASVLAVKNKNVFQMPQGLDEWDSPTPSCILGYMWLVSILHSDVYAFDSFIEEAQGFYQTFYDFKPDAELFK